MWSHSVGLRSLIDCQLGLAFKFHEHQKVNHGLALEHTISDPLEYPFTGSLENISLAALKA